MKVGRMGERGTEREDGDGKPEATSSERKCRCARAARTGRQAQNDAGCDCRCSAALLLPHVPTTPDSSQCTAYARAAGEQGGQSKLW